MVRSSRWSCGMYSKTVPGAMVAMVWMCLLAAIAASAEPTEAPAGQASLEAGGPLAARYPGDAGIKKDPAIVFADDFESWTEGGAQPPVGTWGMHKNQVSRTRVVPGKVVADGLAGPGAGVLEIACWTPGSGSQTGGLTLKLGNYDHAGEGRGDGYEELFVRYYLRFDETYRGVANHGANLGGRDVSRPGSAWVGMAAIRDPASRGYFYSGLQPYGKNDSRELEMGFYSYHLDKRDQWGANYEVRRHVPIRVGGWHCVERHMKLNSVAAAGEANADGIEELWVDGQLTIRNAAVRFRRTPKLRITYFTLETYYHGLPKDYDVSHPIKVFYDNLVIARAYIGPLGGEAPTSAAPFGRGSKEGNRSQAAGDSPIFAALPRKSGLSP